MSSFAASNCSLLVVIISVMVTVTSSSSSGIDDKQVYDFIIVGAGTAGSVVASRLSENPSISVLLLEAGTDAHPLLYLLAEIPLASPIVKGTAFDWKYVTVPQTGACLDKPEQRCGSPRGKTLGGSSRINDMLYVRGNREDYDGWANLGNSGWSYDDVLPYFLKSEDNTDKDLSKTKYHSTGGLLTVSYSSYRSNLLDMFLQGAQQAGYDILDYNGESQMGFGILQGTTKNGRRMDTAKAFLRPFMNRPNLHIVQRAYVQKILIDDEKAAYGVEYVQDGQKHTAKCSKEVIVSGGAINSPQLLMLSGVGPEDQLKQFNIKTLAILRGVGENYMDHPATTIVITTKNERNITEKSIGSLFLGDINLISFLISLIQWFFFGTGTLTSTGSAEVCGFMKTDPQQTDKPDWPDAQFTIGTTVFTGSQHSMVIIFSAILHAKSRGTVRLNSSDPNVYPAIDPKYFSHPDDIKALLSSVKKAMAFATSAAFQEKGFKADNLIFPGCANLEISSDEYLECGIRQQYVNNQHFAGTCKMGPDSDPMAVVDAQLRVRNVLRLRVVDASIMPFLTSGNTMAPTIMIGEKASDLIKETYGL